MDYAGKTPIFDGDQVFVFPVEFFHFSNFHKNEATHDKLNYKRVLTVTFLVKTW